MEYSEIVKAQTCEHEWETGTVYGDGFQGLRHFERRCSECGLFQEVERWHDDSASYERVVATWW